MDSRQRQKVEEVFQAALAAREDGARPAAATLDLTALCDGDDDVHAEVQSLLRHFPGVGADNWPPTAFLDPDELHGSSAGRAPGLGEDALLREWGGEAVGQRVDDFTIIGRLGEGGMGVVYVAEQQRPRRTVALKLMRRTIATPSALRRFEREAQLLGRLNHPGIAHVYAAGIAEITAGDGAPARAPYIAMELVEGPGVLDFVAARGRDAALILRLVAQVCDAVQHAHQRGVIHRDLKPANILVAGDAHAQVKVLDFGVGRMIGEARDADATELTEHGHVIGTLAYMAPEQLNAAQDPDTRCDVYALGVILYHLLSGRFPIDVSGCAIGEAARRLSEREAAPLSSAPGAGAVHADVLIIVATALQKDPARRYQSARELARDIRLYLAGEPIEAKRDSLLYVMRRQAARYRSAALVATVVVAGAVAFAGYARVQASRQAAARADADAARARADRAAERLAEELAASRIEQGRLLGLAGDVPSAERYLWDEMLAHPDSRPAHWALWELYSHNACVRTFVTHDGNVRSFSVDPTSDRVATGGDDGYVRVWSVPDGRKLVEVKTGLGIIRGVRFARDGRVIAAVGDEGAVVIDPAAGAVRRLGEQELKNAQGVDTAPDGVIATVSADGVVRLWRASDGARVGQIVAHPAAHPVNGRAVCFDGDGNRLAVGFDDGTVRQWTLARERDAITATQGPTTELPGSPGVGVLSFSPDGQLIACGASDQNLYLIGARDGAPLETIVTHNGTARTASFSPDGSKIAVAGYFRVQVYDVASRQLWTPAGAGAFGYDGSLDAAFTNDGRYLLSTGRDATLHVWELADDPSVLTVAPPTDAAVRAIDVTTRGDELILAAARGDGDVIVHAHVGGAPNGPWRQRLQLRTAPASALAILPGGAQLVVGCQDGRIHTFDAANGIELQAVSAHTGRINDLRVTPDGRTLISCGIDGAIRVWRRRDGDGASWEPGPSQQREREVLGMAVSRDGTRLVTAERNRAIGVWSLPDLRLIGVLDSELALWRPGLSPDGRWISVGLWDRSIQLWSGPALGASVNEVTAMRRAANFIGHTQLVSAQVFDASSQFMASTSADGQVKLWDIASRAAALRAGEDESRRCLVTLPPHGGETYAAAFLPPPLGQLLAIGSRDGSVRIWDLRHYQRHIDGQIEYQRWLRTTASRPAPTRQ